MTFKKQPRHVYSVKTPFKNLDLSIYFKIHRNGANLSAANPTKKNNS